MVFLQNPLESESGFFLFLSTFSPFSIYSRPNLLVSCTALQNFVSFPSSSYSRVFHSCNFTYFFDSLDYISSSRSRLQPIDFFHDLSPPYLFMFHVPVQQILRFLEQRGDQDIRNLDSRCWTGLFKEVFTRELGSTFNMMMMMMMTSHFPPPTISSLNRIWISNN